MKIPREFADGKTDMAPLIWDLMKRGEFEGIEGAAPTPKLMECVVLCMIKKIPLTLTLDPNDKWPSGATERAQA